jgi:DNA-binding CsgD family transcriptional regulator
MSIEDDTYARLSDREKAILKLLAESHDAKSIARELGLSVHTINEYLRSARRKLGVSSSREAARLLAAYDATLPHKVVDRQIGVESPDAGRDGRAGRAGRTFTRRHIVLAIGGTFAMSLIIAAALFAWFTDPPATGPLPHWRTAAVMPASPSEVVNKLHLNGERLSWNGDVIPEKQARQFLDITQEMQPQPLLVLSHSAATDPRSLQRVRRLVDDVLDCNPRLCLEVTGSIQ